MLELKVIAYLPPRIWRSTRVVELPERELLLLRARYDDKRPFWRRAACRIGVHAGRQLQMRPQPVFLGDVAITEWRCLGCGRRYWGDVPEARKP